MEILAGLVQLSEKDLLPAPWFNRPSLGLITNTRVNIGVLKGAHSTSAPPDIIVTPLRTDRMQCTSSVVIDLKEQMGAVSETLKKVPKDLNIALAETVTIDHRTRHRITLLLEPPSMIYEEDINEIIKDYKDRIFSFKDSISALDSFISFSDNLVVDDDVEFECQESSIVQQGRIDYTSIRRWISRKYIDQFKDKFDFSRVVVSSSADGRFLRYIFPKRGVFQATISHLDVPRALVQISTVFQELGFNILLSRLSRSTGKSIFVAICEPAEPPVDDNPERYARQIASKISEKLNNCNPNYQLNLTNEKVSLGVRIKTIAYPYRHGLSASVQEIIAQDELKHYLDRYKDNPLKAIFVSYREMLTQSAGGLALKNSVFDSITQSQCAVYDGFAEPFPLENEEAAAVRARMWMAEAAVFIVCRESESESDNRGLSEAQLVEWGYFYGQGKPWVIIVRSGDERYVKNFMISDRSFITYPSLDSPDRIRDISRKLIDAIGRWFPKS